MEQRDDVWPSLPPSTGDNGGVRVIVGFIGTSLHR